MKIEIEIPDWTDERVIQIFAGMERIAYKYPWEDSFKIKTSRCNQCGKCCENLDSKHFFSVINGRCIYLEREPGNNNKWVCSLNVGRPYTCCIYKSKNILKCTEQYE